MAFGLIPEYRKIVPLNSLTGEQYLAIALKATIELSLEAGQFHNTGFTAYTGQSSLGGNSEVKITVNDHEATIASKSLGGEVIDFGRNRKYAEAIHNHIEQIRLATTDEELTVLVEEFDQSKLSSGDHVQPETLSRSVTSFFAVFVPQKGYWVTPVLVNINIIIFLLMALSGVNIIEPDNDSLLNWGASFKPLILQGESWRLFTSMFLHIGIIHLLLNMYALAYIGSMLEHKVGSLRFGVAYLCTGIAASVVSIWWHAFIISAGASGAIFGLYGVFLALLTGDFFDKALRKALLTSISIFVAYNLINGLKEGIDNAAHIGGLISGLMIGFALIPSLKKPTQTKLQHITLSVVTVAVILVSTITVFALNDDYAQYEAKMRKFYDQESMALEVYSLPDTTSKEAILTEIKDRGLYYWNANIELVNEADQMDLPEAIHSRNKMLLNYCTLRIQSYQLLSKAVAENSNTYKSELEAYDKKITKIIEDLKK